MYNRKVKVCVQSEKGTGVWGQSKNQEFIA